MRSSPWQFVREALAQLRISSWPGAHEVLTHSRVVLVAIVLITLLIIAVDLAALELRDLVDR